MTSTDIKPPTFPLRPMSGGNLDKNKFTGVGTYAFEPKVNGWRTLVHTPSGTMFNRQGERLSIEKEFAVVLERLRTVANPHFEWLDCEAFERRHELGRGSLVLLDPPCYPGQWKDRNSAAILLLHATSWPFLHEPPPQNELLTFAYHFTDYGIDKPAAGDMALALESHALFERFDGEDIDGLYTGWVQMKKANRALKCELFEGLVAKRTDSLYPFQLVSPEKETSDWIKTRWRWS